MFDYRKKLNYRQSVFTALQYRQLVKNYQNSDQDHAPVVKFFNPFGAATWLISEFDSETGLCFGLCDLGMGYPELGYVSIDELISLNKIERDLYFKGDYPMSEYIKIGNEKGYLAGI